MSDEKERGSAGSADRRLSDEAIDWLVRLGSGRAGPSERLAFVHWRRKSAAHEAAASEAEALLQAVGETRQADELRRSVDAARLAATRRRAIARRYLIGGAAVASVAAVALAGPAFGPLSALYADHATAVGQRKRVELSDGSSVVLNTASAMSVDYSGQQRRLVLHDGEALFEVAKDAARPFVVVAGDVQVKAVGTAFVVRCRGRWNHVAVSEGVVEVAMDTRPAIRVEAGQRLALDDGGRFELKAIDVEAATAWQRGKLIFNRRPLESVMAELEPYAGRIVVLGNRLKALEVTGVFDLDDVDRILRTIAEMTGAQVVRMPLLTVIR
jgi:transmembrane sensor